MSELKRAVEVLRKIVETADWDVQKAGDDLRAETLAALERWRQLKEENDVIAAAESVLMTDEQPDYTTLSGAEFRRAVGADPTKWAAAFIQRVRNHMDTLHQEDVARWFADAMDAAVKAATLRPAD